MSRPEIDVLEYSPDRCGICSEYLHIPSSDEQDAPYVIDDVELHCGPPGSPASGHHFHWGCITEWAKSGGDKRYCPLCRRNTLDENGRFIADVRNEGGSSEGIDLGENIVRIVPILLRFAHVRKLIHAVNLRTRKSF